MSDISKIPKLNGDNYAEWREYAKSLLITKNYDLWEATLGTRPTPSTEKEVTAHTRLQAQARAHLILTVEPSQITHFADEDPAKIWKDLETVYRSKGLGTRMAELRKLYGMQKSGDQPMRTWITSVQHQVRILKDLGSTLRDDEVILALTGGLDSRYDFLIIALDSIPDATRTIDYVIERLVNEETRSTSQDLAKENAHSALVTRTR
jgi:hypothetical protein